MKNTYQLIILAIAIFVTSCGSLNKGHGKKEQMKVDAYAMANSECEYELAKFLFLNSSPKTQAKLKGERNEKKVEQTILQQKFFKKYREPQEDHEEFRKMLLSVSSELTTCKKLETIKEEEEEKKKEAAKTEKKESK
jgi:citrate synthase